MWGCFADAEFVQKFAVIARSDKDPRLPDYGEKSITHFLSHTFQSSDCQKRLIDSANG